VSSLYILAIIKTNLLYSSSQQTGWWSLQNQSDHIQDIKNN